jgi:CRP-like cAMP-binding protein
MATAFLDERTYNSGDIVFAEGDKGTEMFIVQEGKVVVTRKVAGADVFLATLERGDFFGEMALLESLPRSATCRALGNTRLLAIRSGELLMKIRRDPTFAVEMLQHMSRRIRYLDEQIAEAMESEKVSREELERARAGSEYPEKEPA